MFRFPFDKHGRCQGSVGLAIHISTMNQKRHKERGRGRRVAYIRALAESVRMCMAIRRAATLGNR